MNRRSFLQRAGLAATFVGWPEVFQRIGHAQEPRANFMIAGKDRRLIVHSAAPSEIETPLELLREHRLTPKKILFVRNNQTLDGSQTLEPLPLAGWKIEIAGLVNRSLEFDAAELEKLEQVEQEIVLQCSGNGRAFFSRAAATKGAQWQCGAMANVRFAGVPLKAVLNKLGLKTKAEARFLSAEGRDKPAKESEADFEHSLPLADALDKSLLALKLNGQPIPAVHGGPVRLITPGYYATMNIKWLSRLRFEARETENYHQVSRYRTPLRPITPGAEFKYNLENSEPNWQTRVKSVIFAPLEGQMLTAGRHEIRGVAWNDGVAPIEAVELSIDEGRTWRRAEMEAAKSLYAWRPWRLTIDLPPGKQALRARAIDALGRGQPLQGAIHWNPAGYAWNGVHTVTVQVA